MTTLRTQLKKYSAEPRALRKLLRDIRDAGGPSAYKMAEIGRFNRSNITKWANATEEVSGAMKRRIMAVAAAAARLRPGIMIPATLRKYLNTY